MGRTDGPRAGTPERVKAGVDEARPGTTGNHTDTQGTAELTNGTTPEVFGGRHRGKGKGEGSDSGTRAGGRPGAGHQAKATHRGAPETCGTRATAGNGRGRGEGLFLSGPEVRHGEEGKEPGEGAGEVEVPGLRAGGGRPAVRVLQGGDAPVYGVRRGARVPGQLGQDAKSVRLTYGVVGPGRFGDLFAGEG